MQTRRQILKSLTAAALAAIAPIPAMGAAEPNFTIGPVDPNKPKAIIKTSMMLIDPDPPCSCCCEDDCDPADITISFSDIPPGFDWDAPIRMSDLISNGNTFSGVIRPGE